MAKKKELDSATEAIKIALEEKKIIIGTERALKAVRQGTIKSVYLTVNCPDSVRKDFENYSKFNSIKIVDLPYPNNELGIICKKIYSISVVAIIK